MGVKAKLDGVAEKASESSLGEAARDVARRPPLREVIRMLPAVVKKLQADGMTDYAAAMTYYTLQSLFPAVIASFSLAALFGGRSLMEKILNYVFSASPDIRKSVQPALETAVSSQGTAGIFGILGILLAINGASGAFQAAGRALNVIGEVTETRSFIRHKVSSIAATLVLIVLAVVTLALIVVGGSFAKDILHGIGLPEGLAGPWAYLRFPVAFALTIVIYAFVYYTAPNGVVSKFTIWSIGAAIGVTVWLLASIVFYIYIAKFASYAKTYGAIAGIVILLVWLWLTNVALLLGAEVNAVIDGKRAGANEPTPPPEEVNEDALAG